jgi:hypothetical protein
LISGLCDVVSQPCDRGVGVARDDGMYEGLVLLGNVTCGVAEWHRPSTVELGGCVDG